FVSRLQACRIPPIRRLDTWELPARSESIGTQTSLLRSPYEGSKRRRAYARGLTAIRIGTCSWADEALSKYFYPPKFPAKERLAYYAEHFDTVEVDSTFYRLPGESMVQGWADRTPNGFTMHVKAFGLMTRHPVRIEALPEDLRDAMPVDDRGRVDRPPRELRGEVFRRFLEALEPLRRENKSGGILFQFPSYVVFKDRSLEYLEWAREQLGGDEM